MVVNAQGYNQSTIAVPPSGTPLESTGSDVRCRNKPCTDGGVVAVFQVGTRSTSLGRESTGCGYTWWNVRTGNNQECWTASNYLKPVGALPDLCFPVKQDSFSHPVVNWGGARNNGARCHAGIDLFTKSPGNVVAVADGVVTNIFNFLVCTNGWACRTGSCNTKAVMVFHPSLGKTINYGEVDHDFISVAVGQQVKKGQRIGRAGYCGMLHFEIYNGRQNANAQWYPPSGQRSADPDKCARQYLNTKPGHLEDPRPWTQNTLRGKYC